MNLCLDKYAISPQDDAQHPLGFSDYYEFWYFDAVFDSGYSIAISFHYGVLNRPFPDARFIEFNIGTPNGEQKFFRRHFSVEDCEASLDFCAVRMGENFIQAENSTIEIDFREEGFGCQLNFENLTQGVKPNPDAFLHRIQGRFFAWVNVQPRAKVTGKIIYDNKELEVSGSGYHDHNWGNAPVSYFFDYWHWIKLFLPEYTFNCFCSKATEELGGKPLDHWVIAFAGDKLIEWTHQVKPILTDYVTDDKTKVEYPRQSLLKIEGEMVQGEIRSRVKKELNSIYMRPDRQDRAYFRFISAVDVKLEVAGVKVITKTEIVNEFMKP